MLRFDKQRGRSQRGPRSQTRTVWMLLLMLGAVMVLMRQMQQPETAAYLDRVFALSADTNPAERPPRRELPAGGKGEAPAKPSSSAGAAARREPRPRVESGPWAAVEDNAMFLDAEHQAWFLLWGEARRFTPEELDRQAIAEVGYVQLVNQPDVYRGQAVHVRGRILRESVKRAPQNELGIREYHQLVLAPVGGGDWPVIVYCLNLPLGFPRGDGLKEDVAITGLFFKNWSSPDGEGMGLFPVLVAPTFDWRPPKVAKASPREAAVDMSMVWMGAAGAVGAAVLFAVWVARQTRRPVSDEETSPPDFQGLNT